MSCNSKNVAGNFGRIEVQAMCKFFKINFTS